MKHDLTETFYVAYVGVLLNGKQNLITTGEAHGLTLMQTVTMLILAGVKELPMSAFSELFACDASNVTGIIDGLEQKKLVARRSNDKDRRIKMICVEPAGKAMQKKLLKTFAEVSEGTFSILTQAERKGLKSRVFRMCNAISKAHGDVYSSLTE